jgi:hypothetical protein
MTKSNCSTAPIALAYKLFPAGAIDLDAAGALDGPDAICPVLRMFEGEAVRVREILLEAGAEHVSPLLNVGSSTAAFRTRDKPHIEAELFAPMRARGVAVCHLDRKAADGVDLVGDILDPVLREDLSARGFRCVLLCNVLEHVRDRPALAAACEQIVGSGGLILATVPSSFPYHADPIDTFYRPSPAELAALFGRCELRRGETLAGQTYGQAIRQAGSSPLREFARTALAALTAIAWPRSFLSRAHRWLWYRRPYRVSVALLAVR